MAYDELTAKLVSENATLRAEVERLRDPTLSHMRLENGCLDMGLVSPVIEGLATALGGWFVAGGAKNYAEMRLHDRHETGSIYVVTVQKSGAKTPHECRKEAEAEAATLRAEVERLTNLHHTGVEYLKATDAALTLTRAELAHLRADNEWLRALLEPFGKAADGFDGYNINNPEEWFAYGGVQGSGETTGAITVGDLRRARAALTTEQKE